VASEDVAIYRDALGVVPPEGLPLALLAPVDRPLEQLLVRWARHHGPFVTRALGERYAMTDAQLEPVLQALEGQGRLVSGEFHPHGQQREWCEPEVLRRLRRETLAKLRGEVTPVPAPVLARFLSEWHGIDRPGRGDTRLDEVLDQLEGLPLAFSDLERAILPTRVADYEPRQLDERGAQGLRVWVGCGSLGARDGRIALYRRERIALLLEEVALPEEAGALHRELLALLAERGASFFTDLWNAMGEHDQQSVFRALWDLVWWGQVTNDTFSPLRALAAGRASGPARGRRGPPLATAGRWSLVRDLLASPAEPTLRAHARAGVLLDRHGILSRNAMAMEALPQGFAAVYPVLRAMEETGRIRRGHFVEGFDGAQFAFVAAVDRLRAARSEADPPQVRVLAATDPANPYGALVAWPESSSASARPRRAAGARVVLHAGEPVLFVDPSHRRVWTFSVREPSGHERAVERSALALARAGRPGQRGGLRIDAIDGEPATRSRWSEHFLRAGYRRGYRALELDGASGDRAREAVDPDNR
jgi:ATP-dependent Lhr-like helicase